MDIKGRCVQVMDIVTGTSAKGTWQKREFVIETEGQYPKKVCLSLWGDKVNNTPSIGDALTCSINAESREYNGRWYTELRVWKIEGFTGNMSQARQGGVPQPDAFDNLPSTASSISTTNTTDDLPF